MLCGLARVAGVGKLVWLTRERAGQGRAGNNRRPLLKKRFELLTSRGLHNTTAYMPPLLHLKLVLDCSFLFLHVPQQTQQQLCEEERHIRTGLARQCALLV
ncbi:hypothetical protein E2C01_054872 [Portunus trituberculatus]|uniref:Uncharacterized protein n=1 Tax=Portunus trituberculatus TaxID=210409 RepID=A0A5B7GTU1_PORTR|nr:hypothetical protein [Portunus trituberculatus]